MASEKLLALAKSVAAASYSPNDLWQQTAIQCELLMVSTTEIANSSGIVV
jgi:hypothetical protein